MGGRQPIGAQRPLRPEIDGLLSLPCLVLKLWRSWKAGSTSELMDKTLRLLYALKRAEGIQEVDV